MKTMHANSLLAFGTIQPHITMRQIEVLKAYEGKSGLTDREVAQILNKPINEVCPRVGELVRKGLLVEDGDAVINGRKSRICRLPRETLF